MHVSLETYHRAWARVPTDKWLQGFFCGLLEKIYCVLVKIMKVFFNSKDNLSSFSLRDVKHKAKGAESARQRERAKKM